MDPSMALFGQGLPPVPGAEAFSNWEEFRKSVVAGYGTELSTLTGGGALRVESLEATLMSVVQRMEHFRLFNQLSKSPATATVDEWTEMSSTGGYSGSAFNTELGTIVEEAGSYARRVALVKYLMTRRSVSFVQNVQQSLISAKAQEEVNGTLEILRSAEWAFFNGNATAHPSEYDGIPTVILASGTSDQIIDAGGKPLSFPLMNLAAEVVFSEGHYGIPTDLYVSPLAQSDLDASLDPAFRVPLPDVPNGGVMLGSPVKGIRTSWGDIANKPDIFLQESPMPPEGKTPNRATATAPAPPVSIVPASPTGTDGSFTAAQAGTYYYAATSISDSGESTMVVSSQMTVAAGNHVVIVITRPSAADAVGYNIYRGKLGCATYAAADFRLIHRLVDSGSSTSTWTDKNEYLPGCSGAYVLNLNPAFQAMSVRQMLPMTRFQLYPTVKAEDPWAQLLFMYLRVSKALQHIWIKNVLPSKASWKPY
jgi:hypothetical protein